YFCAEFGLTECLPIYCGGLGLLAGDHLKSAAQLGLPLVAVGLLYSHGYFRQRLDEQDMQQELMPRIDFARQPVTRVVDPRTGDQLRIFVDYPGRRIHMAIWRCRVGSVPLYLLDTDIDANSERDRDITRNLYLGDHTRRIEQEIALGVGGVRALRALGENPTVFHMNEGHAAFLALERIREMRALHPQLSFDHVREATAAANVFTTHTPLPAGIDRFHPDLVVDHLSAAGMRDGVALDTEGLMALGRENVFDRSEHFSMAVLAIRTSRFANGVSALHGRVSRAMWRPIWPGVRECDVPIGSVTNGVHLDTWLAPEMAALYREHLGPRFLDHPDDPAAWKNTPNLPDAELWKARHAARARLFEFVAARTGAHRRLDPGALTIGFARRFAQYKRATLLFRDLPRLKRLIISSTRPVQVLLAGKAHPGDHGGKRYIQEIIQTARREGLQDRIIFIEDYDIEVATAVVQGCDLWLNSPVRGLEASGTSGMKAALNGVINCSILDGWWDEAYRPDIGFAFGSRETDPDPDPEARDDSDARSLYEVLETRVLPEFFARGSNGLSAAWLARMKASLRELGPRFNTHRMVLQYARDLYYPAHRAGLALSQGNLAAARDLADHIDRYRALWPTLTIDNAWIEPATQAGSARSGLRAVADVHLGALDPSEVRVQLVTNSPGEDPPPATNLPLDRSHGLGRHRFAACVPGPMLVGESASTIRVIPRDERLITPHIPGLITSRRVDAPSPSTRSAVVNA
ncbi:MAG: alpha-glucan family phosphorylase, partial [Phycisphaerales bacterium]|nr:alpha-glucan family phosphorylase [Phycisphaerales bacterium]